MGAFCSGLSGVLVVGCSNKSVFALVSDVAEQALNFLVADFCFENQFKFACINYVFKSVKTTRIFVLYSSCTDLFYMLSIIPRSSEHIVLSSLFF